MSPVAPILLHLLVTAALLLLVAHWVSGIEVDNWGAAFIAAIVLGLANAFVRPVMILLTLPLTIVSFGLFLLIVNAFMLWLAAAFTPGVRVEGFGAALVGSLLLTLLNLAIALALGLSMTTV